jgi:thymidylate synthase (FAD)
MKLIKPSYQIVSVIDRESILKNIEAYGRTCYKSEYKITSDSAVKFVEMIIRLGHESVLEHEKITVRFICDRGVSHEIVRHRLASFSQESTRYCNYSKNDELTFIIPNWIDLEDGDYSLVKVANIVNRDTPESYWMHAMHFSEADYFDLINKGWTPQQARTVLPNSLKTEIVVTANLREWRTIFKQRTSQAAHPQMREIMCPLLAELQILLPEIFN